MKNDNMKTVNVDIVTDYICPWCYVGKKRFQNAVDKLKEDYQFEINYVPFQLNPDMPAEGQNRKEYRSKKFGSWEKSQAMDTGVLAAGKSEGLVFDYDLVEVTPNTLKAHLLTQLASKFNKHQEISKEIFKSYFTDGKNIGDDNVLIEIAKSAGLNTEDDAFKNYQSDENKKLLAETEHHYKLRGVNSVPLFIIDNKAISGAQPTEAFVEFITKNAN